MSEQVGPNGIGKSTLLKTIFGDHEPTTGHVQLNNKLRIGRFTQHHADQLDMQKTPLEMLQKVATAHAGQSVPMTALRSHLGQVRCLHPIAATTTTTGKHMY